jgi:hypothetical protein
MRTAASDAVTSAKETRAKGTAALSLPSTKKAL